MFIQIAAFFAAPLLDRLRGHAYHIFGLRGFDKIALGYVMAAVAGFALDPIIATVVTIAMIIGMSPGWGEPLGAVLDIKEMKKDYLEWWQKGPLTRSPLLALAFRGAMWGLPVAIAGAVMEYFMKIDATALYAFLPAYMIAMPLAPFLVRGRPDGWAEQEYIRGFIAAGIVLAASYYL